MLEGIRGDLSRWEGGWRYADMTYQLGLSRGYKMSIPVGDCALGHVFDTYLTFVWGAMQIQILSIDYTSSYRIFRIPIDVSNTTSSVLISPPWLGYLMATLIVYLMVLLSTVGFGFLPLVVALHWQIMSSNIWMDVILHRRLPSQTSSV